MSVHPRSETGPAPDGQDRFARHVATLGRGPGRSRALTREEARDAFGMVLRGEADPHQVGAFLMLLRYRGEDPDEMAGLVEAARAGMRVVAPEAVLDWPSYGAGRTRGAPWFLLAALALARAGLPVLMDGSNAFSSGIPVLEALAALGVGPARDAEEAGVMLRRACFAYLPLVVLSPALDRLLGLRRLFGLRSPVNTVARLLNPAEAPTGVDGVFHPAYIALHLGVAERLGRRRLMVLKGGGGEAERNPAKPVTALLWRQGVGREEWLFPAWKEGLVAPAGGADTLAGFVAVWRGEAAPPRAVATVRATMAFALVALGMAREVAAAEREAARIWAARGKHIKQNH